MFIIASVMEKTGFAALVDRITTGSGHRNLESKIYIYINIIMEERERERLIERELPSRENQRGRERKKERR